MLDQTLNVIVVLVYPLDKGGGGVPADPAGVAVVRPSPGPGPYTHPTGAALIKGKVYDDNNIRNTEEAVYMGHNTPLVCHTDQGPEGHSQYDSQGVYCGLSTASEVFLISATQLCSCQCHYNTTFPYIDKREVLQ